MGGAPLTWALGAALSRREPALRARWARTGTPGFLLAQESPGAGRVRRGVEPGRWVRGAQEASWPGGGYSGRTGAGLGCCLGVGKHRNLCAGSALTVISRTQNTQEAHVAECVGEGAACGFSPSSSPLGLVGEGALHLEHKHLTLEKASWKPLGPPCLPK